MRKRLILFRFCGLWQFILLWLCDMYIVHRFKPGTTQTQIQENSSSSKIVAVIGCHPCFTRITKAESVFIVPHAKMNGKVGFHA